jgi:hypothetical protein
MHESPQAVPVGYTHPPVPSQSEAPHVPPVVHVAAQQCVPVPVAPQTPAAHWSLAEHKAPSPPFATQAPAAQ